VAFAVAAKPESCPEPVIWTDISKGETGYQIAASNKAVWIQTTEGFPDKDG
jgi:hypothetical protein